MRRLWTSVLLIGMVLVFGTAGLAGADGGAICAVPAGAESSAQVPTSEAVPGVDQEPVFLQTLVWCCLTGPGTDCTQGTPAQCTAAGSRYWSHDGPCARLTGHCTRP